jgi:hypothetical protein
MTSAFQFARETFDGDCTLRARSESNDFLKVRHGAPWGGHPFIAGSRESSAAARVFVRHFLNLPKLI